MVIGHNELPPTVIRQDLKIYEESGWKLGVSQMETVGFEAFKDMSHDLAHELARAGRVRSSLQLPHGLHIGSTHPSPPPSTTATIHTQTLQP